VCGTASAYPRFAPFPCPRAASLDRQLQPPPTPSSTLAQYLEPSSLGPVVNFCPTRAHSCGRSARFRQYPVDCCLLLSRPPIPCVVSSQTSKTRVLSQPPIEPAREIRSGAAQCSDYHSRSTFETFCRTVESASALRSGCCKHSHPSPFLPQQCACSYIASPHRILAASAASLSTAAVCLPTRTILLPRLVVSQCTWKSPHCPASAGPVSPKVDPTTQHRRPGDRLPVRLQA
jgi:hypothetical protein